MDISTGLIAKGTAGLATAAAATSGVIYRENIANFLRTGSFVIQPAQAENPAAASEEEKKASLGLGGIENCGFPGESESFKECSSLDGNKLNSINFLEKGSERLTIASGTVNLRIEKVTGDSAFPKGLKFIFTTAADVSTNGTAQKTIMKANTNPEFKIKEEGGKWFLERAWTANELGKKVGLTCTDSGTAKECSFGTNKQIRVYDSEGSKTTTATVSDATKKLVFTENEENHNQGFKFVVKDNGDISLDSGGSVSSLIKTNTSYEIKYQSDGWYLSKKTSTPAA